MRKVLLIILLVLVPFQTSWALVGEYCQHESGPVSMHFGHHTHHHQIKPDQPDSKPGDKLGKLHPDCGSCHSTVLALFFEPDAAPALTFLAAKLPRLPLDSYKSHIPDGPREPDRSRFA